MALLDKRGPFSWKALTVRGEADLLAVLFGFIGPNKLNPREALTPLIWIMRY